MIFPRINPKEKQRRQDEDRREAWLYTQQNDRLYRTLRQAAGTDQTSRSARSKHPAKKSRTTPSSCMTAVVYLDGNEYRAEGKWQHTSKGRFKITVKRVRATAKDITARGEISI